MKLHEFCLVCGSLTLHTCTKKWVNTSKTYCKLNTRLLSPVFASFSRTRRFWLSQNPLLQCLIPNPVTLLLWATVFYSSRLLSETFQMFWGEKKKIAEKAVFTHLPWSFLHNFGYLGFTAMPSNKLFLLFILLFFGSFRQEGEISINSSSQVIMKFLHNFFFLMRRKSKLEGLLKF